MKTQLPLLPGETPIPSAPEIQLDDGTNCIPQHYLSYQHTRTSVENIVYNIHFDQNYPIFVDEDAGGIFIQIGVIGLDNYIPTTKQEDKKIVYGRRWRVEPQLPSSEIIQTVFLALLKAREHEVRELFKFRLRNRVTTPFSCHHDLPLMAMSKTIQAQTNTKALNEANIKQLLSYISYDNTAITLVKLSPLGTEKFLLEVLLEPSSQTFLPELKEPQALYFLINALCEDNILHGLMDEFLTLSQSYVEEHFLYKSFARFSRKHSVNKIAALSALTRQQEQPASNEQFSVLLQQNNYETDLTRVPTLKAGKLAEKIQSQLKKCQVKSGILPLPRP